MTKFNKLKVKRFKSNLRYAKSKLVKKDHSKKKKYLKSHYYIGIMQKNQHGKRHHAKRQHVKSQHAERHHTKRNHPKRHHAKRQNAKRQHANEIEMIDAEIGKSEGITLWQP